VWLSFWAGIAMSLTANISAAPELSLQPILAAGGPAAGRRAADQLDGYRGEVDVLRPCAGEGEVQ
jgi:hypothetical protein